MLIKYRLIDLFPWHYCTLCGIPNTKLICTSCNNDLDTLPHPQCNICAKPLTTEALQCNFCRTHTIYFDKAYCRCIYTKPLSTLIQAFKYTSRTEYSYALGYLLAQSLRQVIAAAISNPANANCATQSYTIIPMPLHPARQKERGFNQAEYLLHYYRVHDNRILVDNKVIARTKNTRQQALMTAHERQNNLTNAFQVLKSVAGKNIILVDDVITTGSSANEVAKALKAHGAASVIVCCLARTI